jgi:uncharacterized protein (DUF488 family)
MALMCAEIDPERCHRSRMIGEALVERGVPIAHIDADGDVLTHKAVMDRVRERDDRECGLFDVGNKA